VLSSFPASHVWSLMPMQQLAGFQPRFELPPEEADAAWSLDAGIEWADYPEAVEVDPQWPGARTLERIEPSLRLLNTVWLYDARSRTLFSSDSFSHVMPRADELFLSDGDADTTSVAAVRDHLAAKLHWLPGADLAGIITEIAETFAERDIETIAPSYGCVISGAAVVERHLELMLRALEELAREPVPAAMGAASQ
jgi:hypothetical protein